MENISSSIDFSLAQKRKKGERALDTTADKIAIVATDLFRNYVDQHLTVR